MTTITDKNNQTNQTDILYSIDQTQPCFYTAEASSIYRVHGGYRKLRSFQLTTVIYDGTVSFCNRFISRYSRTHDQMVQAARSGRQNIAEGSRAGATSSKTEIRLVNVARSSQDELLLDYEDFLRQHNYPLWDKDSPEAKTVRELWKLTPQAEEIQYATYTHWLEHENSTIVANSLICLIHQANFLLNRQLIGLEKQFTAEGGFSEKMSQVRLNSKLESQIIKKSCPICGQPMIIRTARNGKNAGNKFWGCSSYPQCNGITNYQPKK